MSLKCKFDCRYSLFFIELYSNFASLRPGRGGRKYLEAFIRLEINHIKAFWGDAECHWEFPQSTTRVQPPRCSVERTDHRYHRNPIFLLCRLTLSVFISDNGTNISALLTVIPWVWLQSSFYHGWLAGNIGKSFNKTFDDLGQLMITTGFNFFGIIYNNNIKQGLYKNV